MVYQDGRYAKEDIELVERNDRCGNILLTRKPIDSVNGATETEVILTRNGSYLGRIEMRPVQPEGCIGVIYDSHGYWIGWQREGFESGRIIRESCKPTEFKDPIDYLVRRSRPVPLIKAKRKA
jgi:hypothetical protein